MTSANSPLLTGRVWAALAVVFLLSAVGLACEVALTRLFSLMFQYHFVFLVVSLAVAGLSIGAALATWIGRGRDTVGWDDLAHAALLLTLLIAGAAVVLSQLRSAALIGVAAAAALLPFAGIGCLNAALFARFARSGGVLYAADLLGGAVGLAAALALVSWLGALDALLALALLAGAVALLLAWIAGRRVLWVRAAGVVAALIAVLLINRAAGIVVFSPAALADAPPDKTMITMLREPGVQLLETRWNAFARVDMVETDDPTVRYVFTDAGAGSVMVRYSGDDWAVSWLRDDIAYLPFALDASATDAVLILGAGAGKDVLMAHLAGAETITAVEINPALVDLTRDSADYNGGVLDLPGVETIVADGRTYVERTDRRYDLIYANIVYSQAAAPGNSALAESYIFTREALRAYWSHLADDGRIGFVTHHGIEGVRLLVAALDMLQSEGMPLQQALRHVALASLRGGNPQTRSSVVLILRQPWTLGAANDFAEAAHARGAGLLYLPLYQEQSLEPLAQGMSLDDYIAVNSDYNYTPTTDDRPFFYQFDPGLPPGLGDLLLVGLLLAVVYFSWLIFFFVRRDGGQWKRASLAPYFAALGAAFMLVEVPLIQRFNLLLGQPVLALVVVIGGLLASGGLGSLLSSRFTLTQLPRRAALAALMAAALALVSLAVYPTLIRQALPLDLPTRLLVTIAAVMLPGIFMGMPFPGGLRAAHRADPSGVAALWGANAIASVLGSALAMALAMAAGFSAALALGVVLYIAAAALAWFTWPRLLA